MDEPWIIVHHDVYGTVYFDAEGNGHMTQEKAHRLGSLNEAHRFMDDLHKRFLAQGAPMLLRAVRDT